MKNIKNISEKRKKELLSLRNSRNSIDGFTFNFLQNFYEHCILIHSIIKLKVEKVVFNVAYRQYLVFLVSCWETFFRDLFVYIYSEDQSSLKKLVDKLGVSQQTHEDLEITMPELLSKRFNFQNIYDLEEAYNFMWDGNFLKDICEMEKNIGIDGKITNFSLKSLFYDWHELLCRAFAIRHNVVHDANYRIDPDIAFIQKVEAIFLLIPQIASINVSIRYGFKITMLSNGEYNFPYIFSVNDILSDDWEIVP